ncbi:peptidoglycan DD-metalloendopeptidase family protein [Chamaesiphon sp.]|uniref:M23 family metallopeptidase n=1 Tax=Chamaesiphon sp. TaxID=2814140 RepID=UPI0035940FC5
MSSKAEKTSHHPHQPPRLSILFRNPLLLKIVAWLGSLSFIGSTGVVWADLQPISTSQTAAQSLVTARAIASTAVIKPERPIYGPYLPVAPTQSLDRVTPAQLPNREIPVAVAPASATILPTGTIVRPQHTDLLTADHYTVGVNGSTSVTTTTAAFVELPVPAPLTMTLPTQAQELVTVTKSQIQPRYINRQPATVQSAPPTSIQPQSRSIPNNGYRSVPAVVSLPTVKSISPRLDRPRTSVLAQVQHPLAAAQTPLTGTKPPIVTPMKSPVAAGRSIAPAIAFSPLSSQSIRAADAIEIVVPAPRTQQIPVPSVARLPQIREIAVPTVTAIPTVLPATASSTPIAFSNPTVFDESGVELIYPLTSPAPTTSSFGWRTHPITGSRRFHAGVDIGAPSGAPVVAAASGTIVSSGWLGGYGKTIVIQHNGVQQTLYGHLSEIFVQSGQQIEQGTVIGRVGSTGNSTGPHLHFETKVSTPDGWIAIDPSPSVNYALANLRRSMPFAQRDLPPGYN